MRGLPSKYHQGLVPAQTARRLIILELPPDPNAEVLLHSGPGHLLWLIRNELSVRGMLH